MCVSVRLGVLLACAVCPGCSMMVSISPCLEVTVGGLPPRVTAVNLGVTTGVCVCVSVVICHCVSLEAVMTMGVSLDIMMIVLHICASGGSVVKNPPINAGDMSSIPGWEDPLE